MLRKAASKRSQGENFSERNSDVVFFVLHKVFEIAFFRVGIQDFAVPSQEGPDWYVILVTPLGVTTGSTEAKISIAFIISFPNFFCVSQNL